MQTQIVRQKVATLLRQMGISKAKLGEVLGSKSKSIQARIDRANRFLKTQKSVSLDEVSSLARFFDKPTSYFLHTAEHSLVAREGRSIYGHPTPEKIDAASSSEIDRLIKKLASEQPEILPDVDLDDLSAKAKRAILRAYYRK